MRPSRLRRRRIGAVLAVALAPVATLAAGDEARPPAKVEQKPGHDGWYDAVAPDGSFRVRMPGASLVYSQQGFDEEDKTPIEIHGVRTTLPAAFGGRTSYVASCNVRKGDDRTPKERLEAVAKRWSRRRGRIQHRRPIERAGHPGLELEITDDAQVIRSRNFAFGHSTCTVLVSWRPFAKPAEDEIAKYLDSFEPTPH